MFIFLQNFIINSYIYLVRIYIYNVQNMSTNSVIVHNQKHDQQNDPIRNTIQHKQINTNIHGLFFSMYYLLQTKSASQKSNTALAEMIHLLYLYISAWAFMRQWHFNNVAKQQNIIRQLQTVNGYQSLRIYVRFLVSEQHDDQVCLETLSLLRIIFNANEVYHYGKYFNVTIFKKSFDYSFAENDICKSKTCLQTELLFNSC